MKFSGVTLAVLAVSGLQNGLFGNAFVVPNPRQNKNMAPRGNSIAINSHHSQKQGASYFRNKEEQLVPLSLTNAETNDFGRQLRQMAAGVVAATAISFAAATSDPSQLSSTVANAFDLNLSKGAIVIELATPTTTTSGDESSTNTRTKSQFKKFDASQEQRLLQTLLKNRKQLGASIGRIQQSIQNELQVRDSNTGSTAAPIWTEIYQEILSIEGDVVPKVQITPPTDLAATVRDLRNGKLNLLVNGEIINVSVEPTFGKDEDDLIIRIKGFKGGMIPKATQEAPSPSSYYGPIRSWLSKFKPFWDSPTTLFGAEGPAFLSGITNGEVVISGTISAIVLSYVVAYSYYLQQNEAEAAEAAAKKSAIAEKAKQKKAAATESLEDPGESLEDPEESSPATTRTPEKSERRHRFRFWKNR
mmetsp:Transcript_3014/g.7091  ORF Transcript_3014/g.7091 Transcript_3014/m.7091 type:complete len:417 (+) Transcript_3014:91-1341(+)|eukprot:CAMPEP_0113644828 /NCGR_PEP_ID=MMETSP0017_2-20120614/23600_1 /TAXON_ID=2856 /ORGANISM="Cylindrotheca closterium" /LENGTH=416 /DNA_ID=CAMNT_0000556473 /DNA_START=34 /DNA_END=1284 /DNA_ORIENTATION=+ /assembly_acc=CAM_ASM_000147